MSTISIENRLADPDELTPKEKALAVIDRLGLTMEAVFVPWSQSRNKAEKQPSLNWQITIKRKGLVVITTDYGAGYGHCPSYKASKPPQGWQRDLKHWKHYATRHECDNGFAAKLQSFGWRGYFGDIISDKSKPILPDIADVLYSLSMDADVLNNSGFEDWASNFGYETDSRKAESIYRACLEIALKLKAAIGGDGLAALAEAFQDY